LETHKPFRTVFVTGADPGFWFGRGTASLAGGLAEPQWRSGDKARRILRHEAEKQTTYGEKKNKSIQTDIE